METSVDRARIVRLGYVLVALVVLFALYLVLSPKSPLVSVGRILALVQRARRRRG